MQFTKYVVSVISALLHFRIIEGFYLIGRGLLFFYRLFGNFFLQEKCSECGAEMLVFFMRSEKTMSMGLSPIPRNDWLVCSICEAVRKYH